MFDFLRNVKDEIVAEVTLMGSVRGEADSNEKPEFITDTIKRMSKDVDYLRNLDKDYGFVNKRIMDNIISNNLEGMPVEVIYEKIGNSFITIDLINETIEAYQLMNFMKNKGYSADEAEVIMTIANVYDNNKDKSANEIAALTNHSVESVNAVIALLNEYGAINKKPFTMESATPNSNQKSTTSSSKQNASKAAKKTNTTS